MADASYADRGKSAWHGQHRENGNLGALLKAAGEGDIILVEDTDRWSREPVLDSLNALRDTVRRGVEIVFLKTGVRVNKDNFNDPSVLFPNFFGSYLANAENEKRSYRIRQAMEAKRHQIEKGRMPFGRLPAWLAWDAPPSNPARKIVVIEEKANLVRKVFALCLEGKGVLAIEKTLRGEPPISNSKRADWNRRFVARLLRDVSVTGCHSSSGQEGIYPPVVTREIFEAAGARLGSRRHPVAQERHVNVSLFTGLVRCAKCGHALTRQANKEHRYLICSGRLRGRTDCPGGGIPAELFENSLLGFLGDADLIRPLLSGPRAANKIDEWEGKLAAARAKADKLGQLIINDPDPSPVVYRALKDAERLAAEMADALESEKARMKQEPLDDYNEFVADLPALAADPARRNQLRRAIGAVVERVAVNTQGGKGEGKQWRSPRKQWLYSVHLRGVEKPARVIVVKDGHWLYVTRHD